MFRTVAIIAAFATATLPDAAFAASHAAGNRSPVTLAASCQATMSSFSFADFSPLTQTGRLAQAYVSFACPRSVAAITLTTGNSGTFATRGMTANNGTNAVILYNIYLDAGHTQVFGDGGGGSESYVPGAGSTQGGFPVYAEIAPGQPNPSAALYSDTLSITVTMVR